MDTNKESVATIDGQGNKIWKYAKGEIHRLDGPAVEWTTGHKEWWVNGQRHREDGPAIERASGTKEWWLNGRLMTKEEWEKKVVKREVDSSGNVCWKNAKGVLHREDGPAIEWADRTEIWYLNGKRHRLAGPAVEWASGTKEWWVNGKLHRLDGPAIENVNGSKEWWVNGQRHRLDGPAVERDDGSKEWWVHGQMTTKAAVTRTFNTKKNIPFVKGTPENVFRAAQVNGWKVYSHPAKNIYFSCLEENFEKVCSLLSD